MAVEVKKKTIELDGLFITKKQEDGSEKNINGKGWMTMIRKYGKIESLEESRGKKVAGGIGDVANECDLHMLLSFEDGSEYTCRLSYLKTLLEGLGYKGAEYCLPLGTWNSDTKEFENCYFVLKGDLLHEMYSFSQARLTDDLDLEFMWRLRMCRQAEKQGNVFTEEELFAKYPESFENDWKKNWQRVQMYHCPDKEKYSMECLCTTKESIAKLDREIPSWRKIVEEYNKH